MAPTNRRCRHCTRSMPRPSASGSLWDDAQGQPSFASQTDRRSRRPSPSAGDKPALAVSTFMPTPPSVRRTGPSSSGSAGICCGRRSRKTACPLRRMEVCSSASRRHGAMGRATSPFSPWSYRTARSADSAPLRVPHRLLRRARTEREVARRDRCLRAREGRKRAIRKQSEKGRLLVQSHLGRAHAPRPRHRCAAVP